MKYLVPFIILLTVFVSINAERYNDRTDGKTTEILVNEWKQINFADTTNILLIKWREIYGATKSCYCKAVFINTNGSQIKLVAPWMESKILFTTNICDKEVIRLTKIPEEFIKYFN